MHILRAFRAGPDLLEAHDPANPAGADPEHETVSELDGHGRRRHRHRAGHRPGDRRGHRGGRRDRARRRQGHAGGEASTSRSARTSRSSSPRVGDVDILVNVAGGVVGQTHVPDRRGDRRGVGRRRRRQPPDDDELHPRRRPLDEAPRLRPDREHLLRRRPQREPHRHPGLRRRPKRRRSASPGRWRTSSARPGSPSTASRPVSCCPTPRPSGSGSPTARTGSGRCSSGSRPGGSARPTDIARGVLFFVSPAAGWVSGQTLSIDGGHSLF